MRTLFSKIRTKISYLDYFIVIPYLVLTVIGIIMVYSASSNVMMANGADPATYLKRQLLFSFIGLIAMTLTFLTKLDIWRNKRFIKYSLILTFILLGALLILKKVRPGSSVNGASAWLNFGPINVQPTEIAKVVVILYLAFIFNKRGPNLIHGQILRNLAGPVILVVLMVCLILLEPDTGGASIIALIAMIMIFSAGIPIGWGLSIGVLAAGLLPLAISILKKLPFSFYKKNYRLARIMSFLYPFQTEQKGGKQLVNSYIAINNGGWFGRGLGNSIQKRGFLPEPYTDFILAVIAEELGVVGVIVILGLLFFLIARIVLIGIRAHTTFRTLICYGVAAMMLVQSGFNIAGLVGILPITGVTLPFISYGGSSMIVLSFSIGLVLNVSSTEKKETTLRKQRQK